MAMVFLYMCEKSLKIAYYKWYTKRHRGIIGWSICSTAGWRPTRSDWKEGGVTRRGHSWTWRHQDHGYCAYLSGMDLSVYIHCFFFFFCIFSILYSFPSIYIWISYCSPDSVVYSSCLICLIHRLKKKCIFITGKCGKYLLQLIVNFEKAMFVALYFHLMLNSQTNKIFTRV